MNIFSLLNIVFTLFSRQIKYDDDDDDDVLVGFSDAWMTDDHTPPVKSTL